MIRGENRHNRGLETMDAGEFGFLFEEEPREFPTDIAESGEHDAMTHRVSDLRKRPAPWPRIAGWRQASSRPALLGPKRPKEIGHPTEPLDEIALRVPHPESDVAVHPEMIPGNDEGRLLFQQPPREIR